MGHGAKGGGTMAMGRRDTERQQDLFVPTAQLPRSIGHVFYGKLNELLAEAGFDAWVEGLCQQHYAKGKGRPGIPPGVYFRMLLVGYFEGIQSQRGIAWRCADSLSLRRFLGIPLTADTPDHSSLSYIRERLPQETHAAVFEWVLKVAVDKQLLQGKTVAVDSSNLEASAAMKSIVRRDTGEDWKEYVIRLMKDEGVVAPNAAPTDEEVRNYDKKRDQKKISNDEWVIAERTFAHLLETGGARRTWLRGIEKVRKRYSLAAAAHNLGVLMRRLFGIGTPRSLQQFRLDLAAALSLAQIAYLSIWRRCSALWSRPTVARREYQRCWPPARGATLAS
jgi:transposase